MMESQLTGLQQSQIQWGSRTGKSTVRISPKNENAPAKMNWNWVKRCIIPRNARVRGQPVGKRVKYPKVQKDPNIPGQWQKGPGRSGKGDASPVRWQSTMPSSVQGTLAEAYPRINVLGHESAQPVLVGHQAMQPRPYQRGPRDCTR